MYIFIKSLGHLSIVEGELDTKAEAVTKVTYIPSLSSFENDVLISLGREDEIKENKCSEL